MKRTTFILASVMAFVITSCDKDPVSSPPPTILSAKILSFSPKDTLIVDGYSITFSITVDTLNSSNNTLLWDFGDGHIETTSASQTAITHTFMQKREYHVKVLLRDTVTGEHLDSTTSTLRWQMVQFDFATLQKKQHMSFEYFVKLIDCNDTSFEITNYYTRSRPFGTAGGPVKWTGTTFEAGFSNSWDIDQDDPSRPNEWYESDGGFHVYMKGNLDVNNAIIDSFYYSHAFSDYEARDHYQKMENFRESASIITIPYEETVNDSIIFYFPLYLDRTRILSTIYYHNSWEMPFGGWQVNACNVSWKGDPKIYIRIKFY